MATNNLLVKEFKLVRQPGQTVTYPVTVPDAPLEGDSQGSVNFGNFELPGEGSITTADCLALGGVPIDGYCTLTNTVATSPTSAYVVTKKYPVVD